MIQHLSKLVTSRFRNIKIIAFFSIFLILVSNIYSYYKTMIIIIDGARYSETFGDSQHNYIPKMWELSQQGSYLTQFNNDSMTYTSRAIPALWSGSWTAVKDTVYNGHSTQYSVKPSIFEYYRKQKARSTEDCFYILKYVGSLWLPSFHNEYGPSAWPSFFSQGSTDIDVLNQTQWVMDTYHPNFIWVYLADVDGAGHSGDWNKYSNAIQRADSIVGILWDRIQSEPFYQDSTYMFVTNDHGRHDDQHGGFSGHGCGCEGCRHIMYLALGPNIRKNFVSDQYRRIPDLTVTVSAILGLNPEYATGNIINEIIKTPTTVKRQTQYHTQVFILYQNYPNPFNPTTTIEFYLPKISEVTLKIFNILGKEVATLVSNRLSAGSYSYEWSRPAGMASGIYLYRLDAGEYVETRKMVLMR